LSLDLQAAIDSLDGSISSRRSLRPSCQSKRPELRAVARFCLAALVKPFQQNAVGNTHWERDGIEAKEWRLGEGWRAPEGGPHLRRLSGYHADTAALNGVAGAPGRAQAAMAAPTHRLERRPS
jgi:hypothetical protein